MARRTLALLAAVAWLHLVVLAALPTILAYLHAPIVLPWTPPWAPSSH